MFRAKACNSPPILPFNDLYTSLCCSIFDFPEKNLDFIVKKYNQKVSCVLSLNVDRDIILKRILGRQTCTKCGLIFNEYFKLSTDKNHACGIEFLVKRPDDAKKTVLYRYKTYLDKTLPILDFYKKLNLLHEIDGKAKIDQIFGEIRHIIASLEA